MSLIDKLTKNSTVKDTSVLTESKFFNAKDLIQTSVPALNVALSGRLDGGLTPGLTVFAGPSKHFKTAFSLLMAKSYLDKYEDAVVLFYDSEFGTPQDYFTTFGIDTDRVIHTPVTDIEQLKFDCTKQLKEITRDDRVIVIVDSVGNLASKKEVEDAENEKSVADMSRAKAMKSLFRIVTPHLTLKDIPMVVVNHTYKEISMYPKDIVSGGTGVYYSADNIFIIGRQQDKPKDEVIGWHFIINVEKSRFVREKSKIPLEVSFEGGISTWSGLLDMALDSGHVIKPANGWYQKVDMETGEEIEGKFRAKDTNTKEFWIPILQDKTFAEYIDKRYSISNVEGIVNDDFSEDDLAEAYDLAEASEA